LHPVTRRIDRCIVELEWLKRRTNADSAAVLTGGSVIFLSAPHVSSGPVWWIEATARVERIRMMRRMQISREGKTGANCCGLKHVDNYRNTFTGPSVSSIAPIAAGSPHAGFSPFRTVIVGVVELPPVHSRPAIVF